MAQKNKRTAPPRQMSGSPVACDTATNPSPVAPIRIHFRDSALRFDQLRIFHKSLVPWR